MKIMKSLLPALLVVSMICVILSVKPVYSSPQTTLSVTFPNGTNSSVDEYQPGDTFSVTIDVGEVYDLFGYEFTLKYDTSVLTATQVIVGRFLLPYYAEWANVVDDNVGYVWYAATQDVGEVWGVDGSGTLATISFTVDLSAASMLQLSDSKLSDSFAQPIIPAEYDAYFTNIGLVPVALFTFTPRTPERLETVTFDASDSYTPPGTDPIERYYWDFGDGAHDTGMITTHYYGKTVSHTVTLTVTNDARLSNSASASITVKPYVANLVKEKAWPEHFNWNTSKYGTSQALYAKIQNFNNVTVRTEALFSVYLQTGEIWLWPVHSLTTTLAPGEIKTVNCSIYRPPPGTCTVEAHATYSVPPNYTWAAGHVSKTFTLTVVD